ncbi:AMP-dependent synthetase/ligase [Mesobacillus harenae]|uniref:AMP-dependent synthetase/ligase n=1 Tax=Mesobacillus harenae TaxID=2213203 RepID=UPI001581149A|nr:long-chain fatty acid--CoA ligase [Mesobacillus harenae]
MKALNLLDSVYRSVKRFPDKKALMWKVDGKYRGITYGDFWAEVRNTAAGLACLGIGNDDKVAILSENNPKWPISDVAILSLGAVSVPIYPTLPPDQVAHALRNADCKAVFVENGLQYQKVLECGVQGLDIIVMQPGEALDLTNKTLSFFQLVQKGADNPIVDWESIWGAIGRDQLATIIHTSGTSGAPKGAMLTHGNILSNIEGVQFWCVEARPEDVMLSFLPLSHVFERMAGQFTPLSVGATIAYAESIETIPQNLQEVKPTVMTTVPRLLEKVYAKVQEQIEAGTPLRKKIFAWAVKVGMERYNYLVNSPVDQLINGQMPKDLQRKWNLANRLVYKKVKSNLGGRMRGLVSGGAALNPEIASFFWAIDVPVLEGYGLTETSPVVATNPMSRAKIGTVGKPLPNLDVKIAEDGEILVKGPSVMVGYYKNEEATAEDIIDGWFHTGDIGSFDDEGFLRIVDRKKRLLILSTGKNVAPAHIENTINQSIYIENSLVVGHGRKYVIAIVIPDFENLKPWAYKKGVKANSQLDLVQNGEVKNLISKEVERMASRLASFEQPKKIIVIGGEWTVDTGEITPSLKVRYKHIEEKYKKLINYTYEQDGSIQISEALAEVAAGKANESEDDIRELTT